MNALTINANEVAQVDTQVDTDRCIGCGLCVTICPTEVIKLMPKSGRRTRFRL